MEWKENSRYEIDHHHRSGHCGIVGGDLCAQEWLDATIYELHYLPGGLCTSWKRRGFTFEGCMHYVGLVGSSPAHTYYRQWKELGVVPNTKMIYHDVFHTFRDRSGRTLDIYRDVDSLEGELLSLSPSDAKEIKALCTAVKRYSWFIRTTGKNPLRYIAKAVGILVAIPLLRKYGDMNLAEYAARFGDPLVRDAFTYLFVKPEFACTSLFSFWSWQAGRSTSGWVAGRTQTTWSRAVFRRMTNPIDKTSHW